MNSEKPQNELSLEVLVRDSGLETSKAQFILEKFTCYFELAHEWEIKSKTIVITDESQVAEMKMARAGRIFIKNKRLEIEKARKGLKEQALREGKAIDGIANVLKALIIPIEEYLDTQEHFIEIRQKEKEERILADARIKEEQARVAKEKADAEEQERVRQENIRLKAEAEQKERELAAERAAVDAARAETAAKEAAIEALREKELKQAELAKSLVEERQKALAEKLAAEEKVRLLQQEIPDIGTSPPERVCPQCGYTFGRDE